MGNYLHMNAPTMQFQVASPTLISRRTRQEASVPVRSSRTSKEALFKVQGTKDKETLIQNTPSKP